MAWWLNRGGQPEGPYQDEQVFQLMQSGQLRGAHICEDGGAGWVPIEQHPRFGPALQGGAGPMPFGAPAHPAPGYPPLAHAAPTRPKRGAPVGLIVGGVLAALVMVGGGVLFAMRGSSSAEDEGPLDAKEAKRRAAACEKSLEAIKKIDAASVPPVESDGYDDKNVYVSFDVNADRQYVDADRSMLLIHLEDMKEPELHRDELKLRVPGSGGASGCVFSLKRYQEEKKTRKRWPENLFAGCAKLEYLAVIRVREHVEPKVTETTENEATKTRTHLFEPGKVAGDVVVFALDSGKQVGGFSFAAESSEKPERTFDGKELETDLLKQLVDALNAGDERAKEKARGGS